MVLSTMHANPQEDDSHKKKPSLFHYNNKNKCGVDKADEMLRLFSRKRLMNSCLSSQMMLYVFQELAFSIFD
jgi:hypothetical protein